MPEERSIEDRLTDLLAEHLGVDREKVTPDADLIEDLGADSLDLVEIVMAIEEEFRIEIPDAEAEKLLTVADATAYIKEHT